MRQRRMFRAEDFSLCALRQKRVLGCGFRPCQGTPLDLPAAAKYTVHRDYKENYEKSLINS